MIVSCIRSFVTDVTTQCAAGLGFDAARQLALLKEENEITTSSSYRITKIILACRNPEKARVAQTCLEELTGRKIFDVLSLDVGDLASCRQAAAALEGTVDGVILVSELGAVRTVC